ncbi:ABC transporter ATP-binding protein [Propioniferax innocua]|uniref:Iron complex transport system ATP-binding protein n=1 Tax=Propioniferax innocua TaxID=1753 RepID=A0A542ZQ68_9ACTN|nr:ATP-binding cassette domain-containing protein [Propioniferax innocua]TQL62502.1 iron complex transport system ATP-binding protein [Propioniferax innocua]
MIEVEKVSKSYDRALVLDDVEVTIPTGGITSIIGPNGAGKSTLLSIIARLLDADAGTVRVAGHDVATTDSRELARILAVLRQDNHLTVRLTVRDLVAFGRYPHSGGRNTPHDHDLINAAITYLDLGDLADRYLDEMSGGQRQRAFVAMVLAQDTDHLLLDEPLNNLDMPHSRAMMRQLRKAADELDKTVVLVVHDINYASCYSDRIIAMRDGRIFATGTPEEIMRRDLLGDLYDMDMPVEEFGGRMIAYPYF